MSKVNFQDNFGTNLTSAQIAGVTTTPLDDIPSGDAPYYLAFDATNVNSKFEIVYVTSDTSTNVNHAATSYAHTTAEEVRLVAPSAFLNAIQELEEGEMRNGKLSVTDAAGITVALKTQDGGDPSVTEPVFVKIGGTVRTITAALSVAKADGTNWMNAGSAELATKEIDYFAYLGYNATNGVVIGFSRYPGASSYDDFSTTTTNEKYCAISTITNAAATDYYNVIGRFAATLSAGAGYTWSVPTYTAKNLIQKPIYETRWLDYTAVITGGTPPTYTTDFINRYKISGQEIDVVHNWLNTSGGTAGSGANDLAISVPMGISTSYAATSNRGGVGHGYIYESTGTIGLTTIVMVSAGTVAIILATYVKAQAADQSSADRRVFSQLFYEI